MKMMKIIRCFLPEEYLLLSFCLGAGRNQSVQTRGGVEVVTGVHPPLNHSFRFVFFFLSLLSFSCGGFELLRCNRNTNNDDENANNDEDPAIKKK